MRVAVQISGAALIIQGLVVGAVFVYCLISKKFLPNWIEGFCVLQGFTILAFLVCSVLSAL